MAKARALGARRKMSFKAGTPAAAKRRDVAEAIARTHPGIPMAKKFKIATAAVERGGRSRKRR